VQTVDEKLREYKIKNKIKENETEIIQHVLKKNAVKFLVA
jgi:hypothetical protein